MRAALAGILAIVLAVSATPAADRAEAFDYYVLALSWNASWCAAEGDDRGAEQCDPREEIGFVLHGLWPQHLEGWPEYCSTPARDPSRAETRAMADLFGSPGLAWHQWKKHGRCSDLDPADYFRRAREAWERIERPASLRQLDRAVAIAPTVIEDAFLEVNPSLRAVGVTVTCQGGLLREVRICLDRELLPVPCTGPVARDCGARAISLPPMR